MKFRKVLAATIVIWCGVFATVVWGTQDFYAPRVSVTFVEVIPTKGGDFEFKISARLTQNRSNFEILEVITPDGVVVVPREIHEIFVNPDLVTLRFIYSGAVATGAAVVFRYGPQRPELAKKNRWSNQDTRAEGTISIGGGRVRFRMWEDAAGFTNIDKY